MEWVELNLLGPELLFFRGAVPWIGQSPSQNIITLLTSKII